MNSTHHSLDYIRKDLPVNFKKIGLILSVVGLILVIAAYYSDPVRSAFNNLVLLMLLTSIGLGAMFLVAIEYIGGAVWSTPFRRIAEFLAAVLILVPIAAIPVYFNLHDLYHWTHTDVVAADKILSSKSPYLNESFMLIRIALFMAIWLIFYKIITGNSKKQDESKDQNLTTKNIKISAIFMPFFALTITFAAIDWMMSLEPHWFSTIYGVYYFSGTVLAGLAAVTFLAVYLNEKGLLVKGLKSDNYYSLGALLFAFTNFWAYIAFSQYMLIWYANLPEETFWYLARWGGNWKFVTLGLLVVHFIVPYFGLLSQPSKMNPKRLKFMSLWILFAHLYDIYWLVMPTFSKESFVFGWIEAGFLSLAVGVILLIFNYKASRENVVAIGDPKLIRGINFRL